MQDEREPLKELQAALGYRFRNEDLLRDAVTHRSLVNERPKQAPTDNERLELLGDAILGMVACDLLFQAFPEAREGELTRRRSDLVCERGLAAIARELDLGAALRLGRGEERSGGRTKPRLLASALEACMAAIYLDGGHGAAIRIASELLGPHVEGGAEPGASDFKSRLQEWAQGRGMQAPRYEVVGEEGPEHERIFEVEVYIGERALLRGHGRSKLTAEQAAAKASLVSLREREEAKQEKAKQERKARQAANDAGVSDGEEGGAK